MMFMAFVSLVVGGAIAQSTFTFKLGGSFPQGKFGDGNEYRWGLVDDAKQGGAGLGFSVGAEWVQNVFGVEGLGVLLSVDAIYNGLNSDLNDFKDEIEKEYEANNHIVDYSFYWPKYINIPVAVGLNYSYALNGNLSVFCNAGIGANMRIITPFVSSEEVANDFGDYGKEVWEIKDLTRFTPTFTFAWRIGAGIKINDKFSIGLDYYTLGDSKVKGETESTEHEILSENPNEVSRDFKAGTINPTVLLLRFGICL